jgi:hypothetical protein
MIAGISISDHVLKLNVMKPWLWHLEKGCLIDHILKLKVMKPWLWHTLKRQVSCSWLRSANEVSAVLSLIVCYFVCIVFRLVPLTIHSSGKTPFVLHIFMTIEQKWAGRRQNISRAEIWFGNWGVHSRMKKMMTLQLGAYELSKSLLDKTVISAFQATVLTS